MSTNRRLQSLLMCQAFEVTPHYDLYLRSNFYEPAESCTKGSDPLRCSLHDSGFVDPNPQSCFEERALLVPTIHLKIGS